jgi:TRAP-type C4-dicarboxylate transport system substrate-binding protein
MSITLHKEEGKMKKISIVLLAFFVASLLIVSTVSSGLAKDKKATVLRMAVPWPPMDPVTINLQAFADKFNERAAGRYEVQIHPAESLLKMGESFDSLRNGAVEMAGWPVGVFASIDRRFAAAEIPFLANNAEVDAAMQVELMPLYAEFMEKRHNMKPVFVFTCLALDIIGTKPVRTTADWNGILMQSISPQSAKFIEAMGGASVAMPFVEGYQALQKRVVNATMVSPQFMIMFKLNEVAQYVTYGYLIPASLMIAINLDTFKKMPKDIQDILVEEGLQAQKRTNDFFINASKENAKSLADMGLDVYKLPKAERDKWAANLKSYCDSIFDKMGPEFSAKVKRIAEKANAKYSY